MFKAILIGLTLALFTATPAQAKKPVSRKLADIATLTCELPNADGTINCSITAFTKDTGAAYSCEIVDMCGEGYLDGAKPGQECLGTVVCKPVPRASDDTRVEVKLAPEK